MSPDDHRHGSRAGYQAHRRDNEDACGPCLVGRRREDKILRYDHHREVQLLHSPVEVAAVLEPWLTMGFTPGAVTQAAGIGRTHGFSIVERIERGSPVRRGTYRALAGVVEGDFDPTLTVHADLTRTRIYSLMAAGHLQTSLPISATGKWRYYDRITVRTAQTMRDFYAAHQYESGPSAVTRDRALAAGHRPPAAWDDPGTLAWPLGWTSPLTTVEEVDEVAVRRILNGDWRYPANRPERVAVIHRWIADGGTLNELARRTGWKTDRYYTFRDDGQVAS